MKAVWFVALDVVREAAARRWFLAFGIALTLINLALIAGLRMDVVDGALAATRLFGEALNHDIRSAGAVLRNVFEAATYVAFYGGLVFGVLACSDFGPELFAPGRIEHLLSLPVRRLELLLGTFLGVMLLAALGVSYGAGIFFFILCAKSGVWTPWPWLAVHLALGAFFTTYACMLSISVFVRSAALSAAAGGAMFVCGIVSAQRDSILALFEPGPLREGFRLFSAPWPRIADLASAAAAIAVGDPAPPGLFHWLLGTLAVGMAVLAVGAWRLESRDF